MVWNRFVPVCAVYETKRWKCFVIVFPKSSLAFIQNVSGRENFSFKQRKLDSFQIHFQQLPLHEWWFHFSCKIKSSDFLPIYKFACKSYCVIDFLKRILILTPKKWQKTWATFKKCNVISCQKDNFQFYNIWIFYSIAG